MPGPLPTAEGTPAITQDAVLAELRLILLAVVGDDLLLAGEVGMDTAFDADLELESIEFVALAEQLLDRYGEQVDFVGWLATMELDEIIALTVGQLVDFVVAAGS